MLKEHLQKRFGEHLRKFRLDKGLSLGKLEEKCDVDRFMLSKIELGKKNPTLYTIDRIIEALETSYEDFFKGFDEFRQQQP